MKSVIQRVVDASVSVDGVVKGSIAQGLLVYLGVAHEDTEAFADWLAEKVANLRIFHDSDGKMNLSIKDLQGQGTLPGGGLGVLAISQFTLLSDARKGRRPSLHGAAEPGRARELYERFVEKVREQGLVCECGEFQAHMKVAYINDGPVTILLDTDHLK
ncbi:MAG: D-aminoacyl-tRNA deacylase [Spirochaetes bacterium]|nr:D-aminoacyl-tRNA deacylase [Spirochaetota bacterium]